jgi:catechol 2,3-dioxygenase-like lactoylglutathione lyase family enzyme
MTDRITANLPAIDMDATAAFYQALGFTVAFKDDGWMILERGPLELEFFPYPDLNPWTSSFSACVRVSDVDALYAEWVSAALPTHGIPRLTAPKDEPFGLRMAALVDLNGSLLRVLGRLQHKG